jgi:hypothetical protein
MIEASLGAAPMIRDNAVLLILIGFIRINIVPRIQIIGRIYERKFIISKVQPETGTFFLRLIFFGF